MRRLLILILLAAPSLVPAAHARDSTTVLPDSVLRYNARQWPLRALPIRLRTQSQRIAIVNLKNRTISPAVQLFIDHLRTVARDFVRGRGQR